MTGSKSSSTASLDKPHVGPKHRLHNIPDIEAYRTQRIHDVDAPRIVAVGESWSELGPRPVIKGFTRETEKKRTAMPRISRKKM